MRLLTGALTAVAVAMLSGCLCINARFPVSMGDGETGTQTATSKAQHIVIVTFGDASITKALENSKIKKIHCVDCEILEILGLYGEFRTTVYGD